MKTKIEKIAEKVISVASCLMVLAFAIVFTVLAVCAGICAIIELSFLNLIGCAAASFIAWFWFGFLDSRR